ncbi:hypothetical protein HPB50_013343 [Hyalomma asiaticum]|uniref:Uncharacterized protein n=1 Tax=Hyalomma asiaticum TaxID=266040 RepID=A0ACB7TK74_HYAAI|nr:hypothetical protein HPB50_013343 [Hyalomma asiaticum]
MEPPVSSGAGATTDPPSQTTGSLTVLLPSTPGHHATKFKPSSLSFARLPLNFWTPCRPPTVPTTNVSSRH